MPSDPFRLQRFVDAHATVWDQVRAELAAGRKRTHWMWFVFPQIASLGRSGTARFYGLSGAAEARAYLRHPVLEPRVLECCGLLLALHDYSAEQIFGGVDAIKLRSCLTLFDSVAPDQLHFSGCINRYFAGQRDPLTMEPLAR